MRSESDGAALEKGLLNGLRVVELGQWLAAPVAGMVLAEQGARVVRITDPSRPRVDPVLDALTARGKVDADLDLSSDDGKAKLHRLIAQTDVVVENLIPGRLQALGVDFESIRNEANPGLISCSIPAFASGDPRSSLMNYEAVVGTAGLLYEKPLGKPRYHEFPLGSVMAGLFGANAVMAALIARLREGRGQHIETTVYGADLFAQILQVLIKTGVPRGFLPFKMIGTPFMGSWLCKDGRYIYLHITLPAHNARILEILESVGYARDVKKLRSVISDATMRDPSQVKSIPEAKKIRTLYEAIFLTKTADEWEEVLGKELCCIKIRTVHEWLQDSLDAGMSDACEVEDPLFGPLMATGPAVTVQEHPPILRGRIVGQKALDELLAEWEAEPRPREAPRGSEQSAGSPERPPLDGVRVMDLTRVIAGPCATRVLAELGADVLSVQSPTGLDWALSFHLVFDPGKRSVSLDFKSNEGKRTLWAIMEEFDPHVFVQNYRHLDVAKAIGVEPEAIRSRFENIVYTHLNAYGNQGIWRDRPGFEQVVQAVSGIQTTYARGGRPRLLPSPVIDIGCGLMGAFATLLGLYEQRRNGKGVFATTHLTRMAVLFQIAKVADFQRDRCLRAARKKGLDVSYDPDREIAADIRLARDGYVCIAGPKGDLETWMKFVGLAGQSPISPENPLDSMANRLWTKSASHWQRSLIEADLDGTIAILPVPKMKRLLQDVRQYTEESRPLVYRRDYPGCSAQLSFVRNPIELSLTPLADVTPPPIRGAHTRQVLARIGKQVAPHTGVIPYPTNKPLLIWLGSLLRWGYFAWRSGNI